jgi:hypothetical protein
MTTQALQSSELPQGGATGPHSELIGAAEQFASLYNGDDRDYIKTDVLNAFYAGWDYARKAIAAQTAQAVPIGHISSRSLKRAQSSDVSSASVHLYLTKTEFEDMEVYAAPPQAIAAVTDEPHVVDLQEQGESNE